MKVPSGVGLTLCRILPLGETCSFFMIVGNRMRLRDELDAHHHRMLTIINELYENMTDPTSESGMADLLKEARKDAMMHFAAEENLMGLARCPGLKEKRQTHRAYEETIARLASENALNEGAFSEDLLHFLKKWWLNHIVTMDKNYAPYLKKDGWQEQ
jgi:hemerythrin